MPSDPSPRWQRLGELLIRRRLDLDPRYRNRQVFADERGAEYRIVSDIERGRRSNFHAATIANIERAYGLSSGAIARYVDGGELDEPRPRAPEPPPAGRRLKVLETGDEAGLRPYIREVAQELCRAAEKHDYWAKPVQDRLIAYLAGEDQSEQDRLVAEHALGLLAGLLSGQEAFPGDINYAGLWDSAELAPEERVRAVAVIRRIADGNGLGQVRRTGLLPARLVTIGFRGRISAGGTGISASG